MILVVAVIALLGLIGFNVMVFAARRKPRLGAGVRGRRSPAEVAERNWSEIAAARGLTRQEDAALAFAGDADGLRLELELVAWRDAFTTVVRALRATPAPHRLGLAPEAGSRAAPAPLREARATTGDRAFDAAFVVRVDPEAELPAILDVPSRAALLAMIERGPRLSFDGTAAELELEGAELARENLGAALDLVARLARGGDGPARP